MQGESPLVSSLLKRTCPRPHTSHHSHERTGTRRDRRLADGTPVGARAGTFDKIAGRIWIPSSFRLWCLVCLASALELVVQSSSIERLYLTRSPLPQTVCFDKIQVMTSTLNFDEIIRRATACISCAVTVAGRHNGQEEPLNRNIDQEAHPQIAVLKWQKLTKCSEQLIPNHCSLLDDVLVTLNRPRSRRHFPASKLGIFKGLRTDAAQVDHYTKKCMTDELLYAQKILIGSLWWRPSPQWDGDQAKYCLCRGCGSSSTASS